MKAKHNTLFNIIVTTAITTSIFILCIKFTLSFKYLYYFDINHLKISKNTNISENNIKEDYDYIINFINNSNNNKFKIPTLPSSRTAIIHFIQVKNIFTKLNYILIVSLITSFIGVFLCIKHKKYVIFKWSSICLLVIPIVSSIPFIINFDAAFTEFHKIVFRNNYWLFDPNTDPIITILPETFFFHCLMLITTSIILFSICSITIYFKAIKSLIT